MVAILSKQVTPRPSRSKKPPSKKKFLTRDVLSKIILPSLFLLLIILTPVLMESFNLRHQQIKDVVDAPVPGNWYDDLFNGGSPTQNIDPDENQNNTNGFMDGFTNGVSDPERELFRYSNPSAETYYWRHEVYDRYTMSAWDKNISTHSYSGYSSLPFYADGEFVVTSAEQPYSGGVLVSNFPAPYNYLYNEEFSSDFSFVPSSDWLPGSTSIEEDIYGAKLFDAQFSSTTGNTTLTYRVSYTQQNNTFIKEQSAGFSALNVYLVTHPELSSRYLQLPSDYSSYAPTTVLNASNLLNNSNTIFAQVYRNMAWLSTHCSYDLEMLLGQSDEGPAPGQDYVEWFLLRRSGTAAHFAAALAIINRLQNIPSRVVVGFSYGEPGGGSDYVIKAKHVHSWVEAFIPFSTTEGYWVAFDPSPLLPGLLDQFGTNTIGFNTVFFCSNEFFFAPHLLPNPSPPPIFTPNPLSTAWQEDPYNPSVYYGPYIGREQEFSLYGILASGETQDLITYLVTGDPGDLEFIEGETITFIDTTTNTILGSAITDAGGLATLNYSYSSTAQLGIHYIEAQWNDIQVPTYNLLGLNSLNAEDLFSLELSGVIISGSVNISNIRSQIVNKLNLTPNFTRVNSSTLLVFSALFQAIIVFRLKKSSKIISFHRSY